MWKRALSLLDGISFKRLTLLVFLGVIAIGIAGDAYGTVRAWLEADRANQRAEAVTLILNDSTIAKYTKLRADKDSLQAAVAAANNLNGRLVAALAIATKPDTVIVRDTVVTTVFDSVPGVGIARTASLTDTTEMGIEVTVSATAPADPHSDLALGYNLFVPSFRPVIAFIETEDGMVASVTWANQTFDVEAPYFAPQKGRDRFTLNMGAIAGIVASPDEVPVYLNGYLALDVAVNQALTLRTPVGMTNAGPYVGVGFEKKLFSLNSFRDLLPF